MNRLIISVFCAASMLLLSHVSLAIDEPATTALFESPDELMVGTETPSDTELFEEAEPEIESAEIIEEEILEATVSTTPRFFVLLPEQIDTEWYWYYYTEISEHIVQAAVEKALVLAGFEVIDPSIVDAFGEGGSISQLLSRDFAVEAAREAGATYLVMGKATANQMSHGVAYGVNVVRSAAEITAKIIRISDGRILAVMDASATAGGQAQKTTGQEALKDAGKQIARKIAREAKKITMETP